MSKYSVTKTPLAVMKELAAKTQQLRKKNMVFLNLSCPSVRAYLLGASLFIPTLPAIIPPHTFMLMSYNDPTWQKKVLSKTTYHTFANCFNRP